MKRFLYRFLLFRILRRYYWMLKHWPRWSATKRRNGVPFWRSVVEGLESSYYWYVASMRVHDMDIKDPAGAVTLLRERGNSVARIAHILNWPERKVKRWLEKADSK